MKHNLPKLKAGLMVTVAVIAFGSAQAAVIDDFNINEGRFTSTPATGSGTSQVDPASTADRVTTDGPFEGAGHQRLYLTNKSGATSFRLRHLSGGGSAANNFPIPVTSGVDGKIGLYVKTAVSTETNWTVSIYLDGPPANALADMDGGKPKAIIPDGQWHLYEWDLDAADWGPAASIGGGHAGATLLEGSHSIDCVFFNYTNVTVFPATNLIFMDFVAWNPNGSVADLLLDPCTSTPAVLIDEGPISIVDTQLLVKGVSANATQVKVYQNTGSAWSLVGTKTTGIVAGNNYVPVTGLVKNAKVAATQVVANQEGCEPQDGPIVGGGANPPVRIALSLTEGSHVTPTFIGQPMPATNYIHFLGATLSAARDGKVFYPSNTWQTVTFERVMESIASPANVTGTVSTGGAAPPYSANDQVSVQVYAFRTVNELKIFSSIGGQSATNTSSSPFNVTWNWQAVPGAEGYKLVREWSAAPGVPMAQDVVANTFVDDGSDGLAWQADTDVASKGFQVTPSVLWNPSIGSVSNLPGLWAGIDAIAFTIDGDAGPYDIYIDDLKNGSTPIHTYEEVPAGTVDYGFQHPGYSGTTSGSLLVGSAGGISNLAADNGTKSYRLQWQFKTLNAGNWLRFTPYGATQPFGNTGVTRPAVRLDQPISFRMLMLPVGAPAPTPPAAPVISASTISGQTVLNWVGGHRLQAASLVEGPYTNLTQVLNPPGTNTYLGPWTNSFTEPMKFFRLRD